MTKSIVVIPARRAATRLPDKPLAEIAGEPMIVHVWRRAMEAGCGPVLVATDSQAVQDAVARSGGEAVLTEPDHASGSDRIHEALQATDPERNFDVVVNLQGDLPTLDPQLVRKCVEALEESEADIGTIAAEIVREEERTNPNVEGGRISAHARRTSTRSTSRGPRPLSAKDRSTIISGSYAYRREALERFVGLPPSPLEMREKLEQLRALEAGMRIHVGLVDTVPLGVDTPADLARAREILETP